MNFKDLYDLHKNLVFNLALHYCQNTSDAEEITQDVFLRIHAKLNDFRNESEIKTWIYRITINKSLDFLKSKKRNKRFFLHSGLRLDDPDNFIPLPNFDHPGVILENKEAVKNIFESINKLPEKQKTAIILTRIEQKKQSEVAEIMNMSVKGVESLLQRAKKKLRGILDQNEG